MQQHLQPKVSSRKGKFLAFESFHHLHIIGIYEPPPSSSMSFSWSVKLNTAYYKYEVNFF